MADRTVRVAVIQTGSIAFDLDATMARVRDRVAEAASRGATLAVLPEALLGGYPKGADFGATVGRRTPEGRAWFARYRAGAVDVPGPVTEQLGELARAHAIEIVIGVIERDGGTLYCTVLFIGSDGSLRGTHRKVMPTAVERLIWGQGDGSTLTVVDTEAGRVGAAICWENYMPQLRLAMYAQGVRLYCAPTVDDRETWQATMRHIALEGRCFVLAACQFARRSDYPDDYPVASEGPDAVLINGGSVIVDPLGHVLAGPARDAEAILCADLDLGLIEGAVLDLDVVGHYARPDIFRLDVDTRPKPAVRLAELDT